MNLTVVLNVCSRFPGTDPIAPAANYRNPPLIFLASAAGSEHMHRTGGFPRPRDGSKLASRREKGLGDDLSKARQILVVSLK